MRTIASNVTMFAQAIAACADDAELMALLPGGVIPRLDVVPVDQLIPAAPGPFVLVREVVPFTLPGRCELAFETHALPQLGRLQIGQAIERIEWIFDRVLWQPCTGSIRIPMRGYWHQTTGPFPDVIWKTIKYIGSLRLTAQ